MNGLDSARTTVSDYIGCNRKRIWCLGTSVEGFRSVSWSDSNISFADCDVLVVTVDTLNQITLDSLTNDARNSLSNEILKRFEQNQLLIICIMAKTISESKRAKWNNYFWCPASFSVQGIARGATQLQNIRDENLSHFQQYLDGIEQYEIGLVGPLGGLNAATTGSDDIVGYVADMGREIPGACVKTYKFLVMLHPLKTTEESVNRVLEILNPTRIAVPPSWVKDIRIPGTSDIAREIATLEKKIATERKQVQQLQSQMDDKLQYKKLAYAQGSELEDIVERALRLVGMQGLKRGEQGKEDLTFTPRADLDYTACVVEVKGIEKEIKLRDLRQLESWIGDHLEKEVKAKGLFVANAFRLQDVAGRSGNIISSTNLGFAKDRKLCILPTTVLLDLCKQVLSGDSVSADKIERTLMSTNGVVSLGDFA